MARPLFIAALMLLAYPMDADAIKWWVHLVCWPSDAASCRGRLQELFMYPLPHVCSYVTTSFSNGITPGVYVTVEQSGFKVGLRCPAKGQRPLHHASSAACPQVDAQPHTT